ncbi:hypothetical protein J2Z76_000022 [Sedimentibacter acidaminivorans]|jgi:hypothetical protein|uniref:DUF2642 domain-containing protein n=1 Tax=Sedimentibacter acidaminivorans TaxID=913099 RepID=A0ABS4G921_9FIRM|nr:hypothetical protein [Sedimentibacter acidaminivorans]MBP1924169.1 hypothetical protein [Sedimentibacter acidaminivorans]
MNVLKFKSFDDVEDQSYPRTDINKHPIWSSPQFTDNSNYLQEYLKSMIGRLVKVDFLIGNDNLVCKEGILKEIGTDYIVLELLQSNDLLVGDLYSIRFVQII